MLLFHEGLLCLQALKGFTQVITFNCYNTGSFRLRLQTKNSLRIKKSCLPKVTRRIRSTAWSGAWVSPAYKQAQGRGAYPQIENNGPRRDLRSPSESIPLHRWDNKSHE